MNSSYVEVQYQALSVLITMLEVTELEILPTYLTTLTGLLESPNNDIVQSTYYLLYLLCSKSTTLAEAILHSPILSFTLHHIQILRPHIEKPNELTRSDSNLCHRIVFFLSSLFAALNLEAPSQHPSQSAAHSDEASLGLERDMAAQDISATLEFLSVALDLVSDDDLTYHTLVAFYYISKQHTFDSQLVKYNVIPKLIRFIQFVFK